MLEVPPSYTKLPVERRAAVAMHLNIVSIHPLYHTWQYMNNRYFNEVMESWVTDFWQFAKDVQEAIGLPQKYWQLKRKDKTKPYAPDNIEWLEVTRTT